MPKIDGDAIRRTEVFEGLGSPQIEKLLSIARAASFEKGRCLFLLGDHADRLYVVLNGAVELTFPLSIGGAMLDVSVETKPPGAMLGWSALVRPYRYTLSARAAEPCDLASFLRTDLLRLFEEDAGTGHAIMSHISEVIGRRLLQVQALWAREVQRAVTEHLVPPQKEDDGHGRQP